MMQSNSNILIMNMTNITLLHLIRIIEHNNINEF